MPNFLSNFDIYHVLIILPGIIIALTVHEAAHAGMAALLGDRTARDQGRLTFNPLAHIDWLGLLFIVLVGFGWAKPVTFDDRNLKKPDRDVRLIAAAGPVSNVVLAILGTMIYAWFINAFGRETTGFMSSIAAMLQSLVIINWGLFVFNLIPIPPLDGSHLAFYGLRHKPEIYYPLYRYGSFALLGIMLIQSWTGIPILPIGQAISFLANGVGSWFGL